MSGSAPATKRIRLLDADPELGESLTPDALQAVRHELSAPVVGFRPGRWEPPAADERTVGFLVLGGILGHDVRLAGFPCTELLGAGDVLRPWEEHATIPATVEWNAWTAGRIAVLDEQFLAATTRWPQLGVAVLRRSVRRSESLATHFAITCLVGLQLRIHTLLWHLADRWGRMTPEGVVLELPLNHAAIAHLVRSRRPSVSAALKTLAADQRVIRQDTGRWLLPGRPPTNLDEIAEEQLRRMEQAAG